MLLKLLFQLNVIAIAIAGKQKAFNKQVRDYELLKVAIIGAGAGGSSLSYYLGKQAIDKFNTLPFEIDLFEKTERVGGRVKSLNLEKNKFELGAGVFVNVNYNVMNATKEFDIEYADTSRGEGGFALYNGQEIVATMDSSYYNKMNFYYRYGWGLYQASKFAYAVKQKFLKAYNMDFPAFNTVEELFNNTGILEYAEKTSKQVLLDEWKAGPMFVNEMFMAISRNIYTIDTELHSLAGAIALIGVDGAYTTKNGNEEIYQKYQKRSFSNLHLDSKITKVTKKSNKKKVWYTLDVNGIALDKSYDYVIIASPLHQSNIKFHNIDINFEPVPYQPVHEMIIQDAELNPLFFNLKEDDKIPSLIFGINDTLPYTVISQNSKDKIVTISANQQIQLEVLNKILKGKVKQNQITHQPWFAYPKMKPLIKDSNGKLFPPINLDQNLYYVNAIEPAISCMEVEILAARNIVNLILNQFDDDFFKNSIMKE